MTDAISGIGHLLQEDMTRLRTISQNVANSTTPGYRAVIDVGEADGQVSSQRLSMRAGVLKPTGRSLDVGLTGDGFFVISTATGLRYTRNGSFQIKADGSLTTMSGDQVMGVDGPLVLPDSAVTIATDGSISSGKNVIGRLEVMSFKDPASLEPVGDSLYNTTAAAQLTRGYQVHQGNLETSNVDVGTELVNMMGLTRHMESLQHGIMAYDQILNSGISEIGKP